MGVLDGVEITQEEGKILEVNVESHCNQQGIYGVVV